VLYGKGTACPHDVSPGTFDRLNENGAPQENVILPVNELGDAANEVMLNWVFIAFTKRGSMRLLPKS
jgi:hypothetical protein